MVNVFNELIVSKASAEDQVLHWKHDTRGIFNCSKNFKGLDYLIYKINYLWSWIDEPLKGFFILMKN